MIARPRVVGIGLDQFVDIVCQIMSALELGIYQPENEKEKLTKVTAA